jgi:heme oxygenase (mycobilin-producing)
MSVTLINIFEVPTGDEDEFIAAWEKTRDYLKTFPAHIETALHRSLHDTQFRFVNIAHWTSEDEFNAAGHHLVAFDHLDRQLRSRAQLPPRGPSG